MLLDIDQSFYIENKYPDLSNTSVDPIKISSNNDTINLLIMLFPYIKSSIFKFCEFLLVYVKLFLVTFYHIYIVFFILVLVFAKVLSFDYNGDISNSILFSAYFNKAQPTLIIYDKIKQNGLDANIQNQDNIDLLYNNSIENHQKDLRDLINSTNFKGKNNPFHDQYFFRGAKIHIMNEK